MNISQIPDYFIKISDTQYNDPTTITAHFFDLTTGEEIIEKFRYWTDQEIADNSAKEAKKANNKQIIIQSAWTAWQNNKNYLALPAPTNAQAFAQIKALTRQINGIIRVIANNLDDTN